MNKVPAILQPISRQLVTQHDVNMHYKQIKQVFHDIKVLSSCGHTSLQTYHVFPPAVHFFFQQHGFQTEERYTNDLWREPYTIIKWKQVTEYK